MKIYSVTDVHEAYENFELFYNFAKKNDADMICVLGDIVDKAFYKEKDALEYNELSQIMNQITSSEIERRNVHKNIKLSPFEFVKAKTVVAEEILCYGNYPKQWEQIAKKYLYLIDNVASKNMDRKYRIMKGFIRDNDDVLALPGNHDKSLEETVLNKEDVHLKSKEIKGVKVAGFGGGGICNLQGNVNALMAGAKGTFLPLNYPFVPTELVVDYNDFACNGEFYSDGIEHFKNVNPDVVLLHTPAYGCCDEVPSRAVDNQNQDKTYDHSGSLSSLDYILKSDVKLVLSGHIHGAKGVRMLQRKQGPVFAINSGTLKSEDCTSNNNREFVEILLDDNDKSFKECTFYRVLKNGQIIDTKSFVYDKSSFALREINKMPELMIVSDNYDDFLKINDKNFYDAKKNL